MNKLDKNQLKGMRHLLRERLRGATATLQEVPREQWPNDHNRGRLRVLMSKHFLVQAFNEGHNGCIVRLSVNRCQIDGEGRWKDGITWDELQDIKSEAGYGAYCAVEVYPPVKDVVNDANMRHLWILPEPLQFAWNHDGSKVSNDN